MIDTIFKDEASSVTENESEIDKKSFTGQNKSLVDGLNELKINLQSMEGEFREKLKEHTKKLKDQNTMIFLGFIVLIVMVATMVVDVMMFKIDSYRSMADSVNNLSDKIIELAGQGVQKIEVKHSY